MIVKRILCDVIPTVATVAAACLISAGVGSYWERSNAVEKVFLQPCFSNVAEYHYLKLDGPFVRIGLSSNGEDSAVTLASVEPKLDDADLSLRAYIPPLWSRSPGLLVVGTELPRTPYLPHELIYIVLKVDGKIVQSIAIPNKGEVTVCDANGAQKYALLVETNKSDEPQQVLFTFNALADQLVPIQRLFMLQV